MITASPAHCSLCRLAHTQAFSDLDSIALAEYNTIGFISTFPATKLLFREDQPSDRVIVLHTGHAKLSCTSKDGRSMILKIAAPGHILGLRAALSGDPYEVSAQAIDAITSKSICRNAFIGFIERHRAASLQVARSLAAEYKAAFDDVRRLGLSTSVPSRLASLLMGWRTVPLEGQPEARFQMLHTHDEIAAFAATSRESVTRTLSKFRHDKYIHVQGIWIKILEPEKLALLAV